MKNVFLHRLLNSSSLSSIRFDQHTILICQFSISIYTSMCVYLSLSLSLYAHVKKKNFLSLSLFLSFFHTCAMILIRINEPFSSVSFSLSFSVFCWTNASAAAERKTERKNERNRSESNFLTVNRKRKRCLYWCWLYPELFVDDFSFVFAWTHPDMMMLMIEIYSRLLTEQTRNSSRWSTKRVRRWRFHRHWWWCKFAFLFHCRHQYKLMFIILINRKIKRLMNFQMSRIKLSWRNDWEIVWKCRWASPLVSSSSYTRVTSSMWNIFVIIDDDDALAMSNCLSIDSKQVQYRYSSIFSQLNVIQSQWGQKMMM